MPRAPRPTLTWKPKVAPTPAHQDLSAMPALSREICVHCPPCGPMAFDQPQGYPFGDAQIYPGMWMTHSKYGDRNHYIQNWTHYQGHYDSPEQAAKDACRCDGGASIGKPMQCAGCCLGGVAFAARPDIRQCMEHVANKWWNLRSDHRPTHV